MYGTRASRCVALRRTKIDRTDQILHDFIGLPVIMIMPFRRNLEKAETQTGEEEDRKMEKERNEPDRCSSDATASTIFKSWRNPREEGFRETCSTRSRPLIYDKGERWPKWCKLGVISHHLGIRCIVWQHAGSQQQSVAISMVHEANSEKIASWNARTRVIFVHSTDSEGFCRRFSPS